MANLIQFLNLETKQTLKRYYYICGDVKKSVELAVNIVFTKATPLQTEYQFLYGGKSTMADIKEALWLQSNYTRLIVIRDAERVKDWQTFYDFLPKPKMTTMVLVTGEKDPRKGKHPDMFRWIAKYGRFVECRQFTYKQAIAFIQYYMGVDEYRANELYTLLGTDTDAMVSELHKIKLAAITNYNEILAIVSASYNRDYFREYVTKPHKDNLIPIDNFAQTIGLLELDLIRQAAVYGLLKSKAQTKDIITRTKIPPFVIKDIIDRAAVTTPEQLAQRLHTVTQAQNLYRKGVKKGLPEWFARIWSAF